MHVRDQMTHRNDYITPEGDQMTPKGDQMILESDHYGRISCHRLMSLSSAMYTKHYVHILRYNKYSHNYQSNVYHIE
jgi:hypothetical protein